jgi:ribonuclease HI
VTTTNPPQPLVAIYADESCLGNGREGSNPGGAGGVIEYLNPKTGVLSRHDFWISEPATTNNRMALRSAIEAFRILSAKGRTFRVLFTTDSQYLARGMNEWVYGWMRRGWRRTGGPIENLDLWRELVEAARPHRLNFRWVRGHDGHPQNEYVNHLAIRAAREQTASAGAVPSEFDPWTTAQRAKGVVKGNPDPFPGDAAFKANPALPVVASPSFVES